MKNSSNRLYCVVVEGSYLSEAEAKRALLDPFIEDWVEERGHFRAHNLSEIEAAPGIALGALAIEMIDEGVFEITSADPDHPLTEHRARCLAETIRRHSMFDAVDVEPCDENGA